MTPLEAAERAMIEHGPDGHTDGADEILATALRVVSSDLLNLSAMMRDKGDPRATGVWDVATAIDPDDGDRYKVGHKRARGKGGL